MRGIPEEHLVSIFIFGLHHDIGTGVRLFQPQNLSAAFDVALRQEDVINATTGSHFTKPLVRSIQTKSFTTFNTTPTQKNNLPSTIKWLSWLERKERREKGLCFNCDKLYHPGNNCEKSRLLYLEGVSGLTITEVEDFGTDIKETTAEQTKWVETSPEISLHALMGSPFPNTMRITGYIKGKSITILIDSGSTHNFLHPAIAKQCGYYNQSNDAAMRVMIGDGGFPETRGSCANVPFKLQNYHSLLIFTSWQLLVVMQCLECSGYKLWVILIGILISCI